MTPASSTSQATPHGATLRSAHRPCPWWLGYFLASPVRRLLTNPDTLLAPFVRPGMRVLDVGCAMGFFSLPLARLVGKDGRVLCVDLQPKMIAALLRRADRAGLRDRIEVVLATPTDLTLAGHASSVDFAVAIHVLHELPDLDGALTQIRTALKPGAALFVREPRGHVSQPEFAAEVAAARRAGFLVEIQAQRLTALFRRPVAA